ncbi:MAG: hypothetical protein HKO62_09210, partial [Gammaproteobacteria bacterium]|nr:hypothetical protein [Gammaproteobacteria bacterium]
IKLMENFNSPLLRQNLAEFWRAWHISLSGWARDYIYFPVLGKYRSTSLALIATMMMIGAWHSPAPGWLLWGLHHGVGLVLLSNYHRWAEGRPAVQALRNTAAWRFFGMLATWWYVAIGYGLTFVPYDVITSLTIYGRIVTLGLWN